MGSLSLLRIDFASWVTAAHVVAITVGLGGALATGLLLITRAVFRPVTAFVVEAVEALSRFVLWGLALAWITGALLAWVRFGGGVPASPRFIAKVLIVSILTISTGLLRGFVLPFIARRVGTPLFAGADLRRCAGFALVAAASSVSWLAPVLLGIARELGPRASLAEVIGVYGAAVGIVFVVLTTLASGSRLILRDGARSSCEPAAVGPRGGLAWGGVAFARRAIGARALPSRKAA